MRLNDIKQVLTDVYNTILPNAKKCAINLVLEIEENLPQAIFDYDKIIQAVTNLVSNAIKFTPENGKVTINAKCTDKELVIRISDNGLGIPEDKLLKIFERFYRVDRPGKQIQGTGLGLAIVKKIIMTHDGRIDVESELDRGTSFTVFLPLTHDCPTEHLPEEAGEILEKIIGDNQ